MKKISIKLLALFLVVLMVFPLAGCNDNNKVKMEKGPLGSYSPKITVTYSKPFWPNDLTNLESAGWTIEKTGWTDAIEAELGVKVKLGWHIEDPVAYFERLSSAIVEGTVPDIMDLGAGEEAWNLLKKLYEAKLSTDIDSVLKDYVSPENKAIFDLGGEEIFYPATFEGKLYGLPQVSGGEATAKCFYYIRKDWLDGLGLQAPKNYEELNNIIEAFAKQDPDGNGIADTYGMTFTSTISSLLDAYCNGFNAYPNIWIEKDGNLVYGSVQPEMKTALSNLSNLYKSGYVNYSALQGVDPSADFWSGKTGIIIGQTNSSLLCTETFVRNPNTEIVVVPAFKEDGSIATVTSGLNSYRYYAASKNFKYPEVLIKLSNFFLSKMNEAQNNTELFNKLFYSSDGNKHFYNYAPVVQEDYPGRNYQISVNVAKALEAGNIDILTTSVQKNVYSWVTDFTVDDKKANFGWNLLYGIGGTQSMQKAFFDNNAFRVNKFNGSPTETMALKRTDLNSMELDVFSKIITGELEIDYFDTFVNEWNTQGGSAITTEVNNWYNSVKRD